MSIDTRVLNPIWFVEGCAGYHSGASFRDTAHFQNSVGPYSSMFGLAQDSSVTARQARIRPQGINCILPKSPIVRGKKLVQKQPNIFGSAALIASVREPSVLSVCGIAGLASWEGKLPSWATMLSHAGLCLAENGQAIGTIENYCNYYAGRPIPFRNQFVEEGRQRDVFDLYSLVSSERRRISSALPNKTKLAPKLVHSNPEFRVTGFFRILEDDTTHEVINVVLAPSFSKEVRTQQLAFTASIPRYFLDEADATEVLPSVIDHITSHLWLYDSLRKLNTAIITQVMVGKKPDRLLLRAQNWFALAEPSWDLYGLDGKGYRIFKAISSRIALRERWLEALTRLSRLT